MIENIQKLMPTQQCYLEHVFSWFLLTQMILYYAICQKIIPNQYVFILAVAVSQGKCLSSMFVLHLWLQMMGLILGFPYKNYSKFGNSDWPMMVNKLFSGSPLGIVNKLMKKARGQVVLDKGKKIKESHWKCQKGGRGIFINKLKSCKKKGNLVKA